MKNFVYRLDLTSYDMYDMTNIVYNLAIWGDVCLVAPF